MASFRCFSQITYVFRSTNHISSKYSYNVQSSAEIIPSTMEGMDYQLSANLKDQEVRAVHLVFVINYEIYSREPGPSSSP